WRASTASRSARCRTGRRSGRSSSGRRRPSADPRRAPRLGSQSKAVLVTGCSTGIGRATAEHLAEKGWTVYATARRPESIADLGDKGCRTLALDVTSEDSMRAAVAEVEAAEGAVGVL